MEQGVDSSDTSDIEVIYRDAASECCGLYPALHPPEAREGQTCR